jgi:hypothetical protein
MARSIRRHPMETRRKWPIVLALVLAMLSALSGGSGHTAVAGVAPALAANPVVYAVEVDRVQAPLTFGGSATKTDGAGNLFTAVIVYNGNDTEVLIKKRDPSGATVGTWSVLAPPPPSGYDKADSVGLTASGDRLLVELVSHLTLNRDYVQSVADIPGVYVPFPGAAPEDGRGVTLPGSSASCPTADENAAATMALLQPYIDRKITTVLNSLQPQARAAIDSAFNGAAGSDPVYKQLLNTSYAGAQSALREAAARTPTPRP